MQSRIYYEKKTYFLEQYEKLHFCHIILIYLGPEIVYFHQIHISVTFSNRELEFILRNSIWNLLIFMRTLLILHSHVPCYGVHMIHTKNCQIYHVIWLIIGIPKSFWHKAWIAEKGHTQERMSILVICKLNLRFISEKD